jgi:hypothetical protein
MKMRKTISVALTVTMLASFACWLGYQHGNTHAGGRLRIATTGKLKQVGLQFRSGHNEISHFGVVTGTVIAPIPEAEER